MGGGGIAPSVTVTTMVPGTALTPTAVAVACFALAASVGHAQQTATVAGRISVLYRGNRLARDVGQAVVWLETNRRTQVTPDTVQIIMAGKAFRPSVVVVTVGSSVAFPNNDPFDHNVFSLSQAARFNLGFYGRGTTRRTTFSRPGIIRIYCNVHARMTAFVVVRDNPHFTQPSGDGSFVIENIPPGRYGLHAWHERAGEYSQEVEVFNNGVSDLDIQLDARRYGYVQYRNKYGRPYARRGRRY